MKTFFCDFGGGITCECKAADNPPERGNHIQEMVWTGDHKKPEILPLYMNWICSVDQQLSNEWGVNLMRVFTAVGTPMGKTVVVVSVPFKPQTRRLI